MLFTPHDQVDEKYREAAIILPHGVLFREAEGRIREEIKRGLIKGIIGLPANLWRDRNSGVIVLDKETLQP